MRGLLAARLDPEKRYGIWWFNRRSYASKQVAVPVPDSGIPREWIDAARDSIKDNKRPSTNAERFWELSGGVMLCAKCGCRMVAYTSHEKKSGNTYHYYMCPKRKRHGVHDACANKKHNRAEQAEAAVWELVSGLLKNPERLHAGLEAIIEQERAGMLRDPDRGFKSSPRLTRSAAATFALRLKGISQTESWRRRSPNWRRRGQPQRKSYESSETVRRRWRSSNGTSTRFSVPTPAWCRKPSTPWRRKSAGRFTRRFDSR